MKNTAIIILLGFVGFTANAQRVIEKNINYKDQLINVEVPFASDIQLETWDKPEVYIKANLTTEDGKYLDLYELNVQETSAKIEIISKPEAVFKAYQDDNKMRNNSINDNVILTNGKYEFNYIIYVPEGADVTLSSINGNVSSEVIKGDFTADLINGDIDIKKHSGNLELKTINGEIDVSLKDSNVKAETIHGNIYADKNLEFISDKRMIGQHIESKNKNGSNNLVLNTINGNMYLRK